MINEKYSKLYCCEDISKIYGYKEAVADKENMWHLHHCLGLVWSKEQLIEMGLYYNQPADRLMFVTRSEHSKLHIIASPIDYFTELPPWNKGKTGLQTHDKEWCVKQSQKMKNHPKLSKKVYQYTKDGKFVKEWCSLSEIQRQLGLKIGPISSCCLGITKTSYNFKWSYEPINFLQFFP